MMDAAVTGTIAAHLPEFSELVRTHQRMVFSIACHFLQESAVAEELAQDVFLQLHRVLPSLQSEAHLIAWLRKVTSHRCVDYARRRRRHLRLEQIPEPETEADPGDSLMARRLSQMVASLPPKARIVIVLRYQKDLEPEEIARVLGWRVNTVKSQLHRSLGMLREKWERTLGAVKL
jgi:RNA polymerase sigma-70 factor (ECF subfamily)